MPAPNRRVATPQRGAARLVFRRPPAGAQSPHNAARGALVPLASEVASLVHDARPSALHAVELAGLLHELSARLLSADDMSQALDRLAACVAAALPGAVRCSVVLIGEGDPLIRAAHGVAGRQVDDAQFAGGAGPGLEAARTRSLITAPDLVDDPRWPDLAECARADGVGAVAAIPIDVRRTAVGALSIYLTGSGPIDPDLLLTAMALASQAEVMLGELSRRAALGEGAVVDRAAGVIIAQRGCGVHEAYAVLQETAQRLGLDRRAVAERLIAAAARNAT